MTTADMDALTGKLARLGCRGTPSPAEAQRCAVACLRAHMADRQCLSLETAITHLQNDCAFVLNGHHRPKQRLEYLLDGTELCLRWLPDGKKCDVARRLTGPVPDNEQQEHSRAIELIARTAARLRLSARGGVQMRIFCGTLLRLLRSGCVVPPPGCIQRWQHANPGLREVTTFVQQYGKGHVHMVYQHRQLFVTATSHVLLGVPCKQ